MDFKTISFWALLVLFTLPGFIFGWLKLVAAPSKIEHFARLGIGVGAMRALGLAEILANVLLFFPQSRPLGMAAWLVILLGANYFNIAKKEPREELNASFGVLCALGVLWWLNG